MKTLSQVLLFAALVLVLCEARTIVVYNVDIEVALRPNIDTPAGAYPLTGFSNACSCPVGQMCKISGGSYNRTCHTNCTSNADCGRGSCNVYTGLCTCTTSHRGNFCELLNLCSPASFAYCGGPYSTNPCKPTRLFDGGVEFTCQNACVGGAYGPSCLFTHPSQVDPAIALARYGQDLPFTPIGAACNTAMFTCESNVLTAVYTDQITLHSATPASAFSWPGTTTLKALVVDLYGVTMTAESLSPYLVTLLTTNPSLTDVTIQFGDHFTGTLDLSGANNTQLVRLAITNSNITTITLPPYLPALQYLDITDCPYLNTINFTFSNYAASLRGVNMRRLTRLSITSRFDQLFNVASTYTNLTYVIINNVPFSSVLPAVWPLAKFPSLTALDLSETPQFTNTSTQPQFGTLHLITLRLADTLISGSLTNYTFPSQLVTLDLRGTRLSGAIPALFASQTSYPSLTFVNITTADLAFDCPVPDYSWVSTNDFNRLYQICNVYCGQSTLEDSLCFRNHYLNGLCDMRCMSGQIVFGEQCTTTDVWNGARKICKYYYYATTTNPPTLVILGVEALCGTCYGAETVTDGHILTTNCDITYDYSQATLIGTVVACVLTTGNLCDKCPVCTATAITTPLHATSCRMGVGFVCEVGFSGNLCQNNADVLFLNEWIGRFKPALQFPLGGICDFSNDLITIRCDASRRVTEIYLGQYFSGITSIPLFVPTSNVLQSLTRLELNMACPSNVNLRLAQCYGSTGAINQLVPCDLVAICNSAVPSGLTASVPTEFGYLSSLTYFSYIGTQNNKLGLTGDIPAQLLSLPNLAYFRFSVYPGAAPRYNALRDMSNPFYFFYRPQTYPSVSMPTTVSTSLVFFKTENVAFTQLPTELGLTHLTYLSITGGQVVSTLPSQISNLSGATFILSGSSFSGALPCQVAVLRTIDLAGGNYTGFIPEIVLKAISNGSLTLQDNPLQYEDITLPNIPLTNLRYSGFYCPLLPTGYTSLRSHGVLGPLDAVCNQNCPPGQCGTGRVCRIDGYCVLPHQLVQQPTCETLCSNVSSPCLNGGSCTASGSPPYYTCTCLAGSNGTRCETDGGICSRTPTLCQNGGTCTSGNATFNCSCAAGYGGPVCQYDLRNCQTVPCTNGGVCTPYDPTIVAAGFLCNCTATNFTDDRCTTPYGVCRANPCLNDGVCTQLNSTARSCACVGNTNGTSCENNYKGCDLSPCFAGTCQAFANGTYQCHCPNNTSGALCQTDMRGCDGVNLCLNGGTCAPVANASYSCSCTLYANGTNCENRLDPCGINPPCLNGGTCYNGFLSNSSFCNCATGYGGDTCNLDLSGCIAQGGNPCQGGGTCVPAHPGAWSCHCPQGLTGSTCAVVHNQCYPLLCNSLADLGCSHGGLLHYCECDNSTTGNSHNCNSTDPCLDVACSNSGLCHVRALGHHCFCKTGYYGPGCDLTNPGQSDLLLYILGLRYSDKSRAYAALANSTTESLCGLRLPGLQILCSGQSITNVYFNGTEALSGLVEEFPFDSSRMPDLTTATWDHVALVNISQTVRLMTTSIQRLNVYNGVVNGSLPTELGLLTTLTQLIISGTTLAGSMPSQLGTMALSNLVLTNNLLSGSIPDNWNSQLNYLSLSYNYLTGTIPQTFGRSTLSFLTVIYLNDNQLYGTIPSELGLQSNFTTGHFENNLLRGYIPQSMYTPSTITEMFLGGNYFTCETVGNMTNYSSIARNDYSAYNTSCYVCVSLACSDSTYACAATIGCQVDCLPAHAPITQDIRQCRNTGQCLFNSTGFEYCLCPSYATGDKCETLIDPCTPYNCTDSGIPYGVTCTGSRPHVFICGCNVPGPNGTCNDTSTCDAYKCGTGTCVDHGNYTMHCNCPTNTYGAYCNYTSLWEEQLYVYSLGLKSPATGARSFPLSSKVPVCSQYSSFLREEVPWIQCSPTVPFYVAFSGGPLGSGYGREMYPMNFSAVTAPRLDFYNIKFDHLAAGMATLNNAIGTIKINYCDFGGSLPNSFGTLTNLKAFAVVNSRLTGTIPDNFMSTTILSQLLLCGLPGETGLTGTIPTTLQTRLINNGAFWFAAFANNSLTGPFPTILANSNKTAVLLLERNPLDCPWSNYSNKFVNDYALFSAGGGCTGCTNQTLSANHTCSPVFSIPFPHSPYSITSTQHIDCVDTTCLHSGNCTFNYQTGLEHCNCTRGYDGDSCEIRLPQCVDSPCGNGGTCTQLNEYYTCACVTGWEGLNCTTMTNLCNNNTQCLLGSTCIPSFNNFSCSCLQGTNGTRCQNNYRGCNDVPCYNNGTCTALLGGNFTCGCLPGYNGTLCQYTIDQCSSVECLNYGGCISTTTSYRCGCPTGFNGTLCESNFSGCLVRPCVNGGTCYPLTNGTYGCACASGFNGTTCSNDYSHCNGINPCQNGATCTPLLGDYNCTCATGFYGKSCAFTDPCTDNLCQHSATCIRGLTSYRCQCTPIYGGALCDTYIGPDPCLSAPCQHAGTCNRNATEYTCTCTSLFNGSSCQTYIGPDPCTVNPCTHNGTCIPAADQYTCNCTQNYGGTNCTTYIGPDPCLSHPCLHASTCTSVAENYTCHCRTNFTGTVCQNFTGVDPCTLTPCGSHGNCTENLNLTDNYLCTCDEGYLLPVCLLDPRSYPCASFPCGFAGYCTPGVGDNTFTCTCDHGWVGAYCNTTSLLCSTPTCANNGTCVRTFSGDKCSCPYGYGGHNCSDTACSGSVCQHGGSCNATDMTCTCASGYTGSGCELPPTACYTTTCQSGGTCHLSPLGAAVCVCTSDSYGPLCEYGRTCVTTALFGEGCTSKDPCYGTTFQTDQACVNTGTPNHPLTSTVSCNSDARTLKNVLVAIRQLLQGLENLMPRMLGCLVLDDGCIETAYYINSITETLSDCLSIAHGPVTRKRSLSQLMALDAVELNVTCEGLQTVFRVSCCPRTRGVLIPLTSPLDLFPAINCSTVYNTFVFDECHVDSENTGDLVLSDAQCTLGLFNAGIMIYNYVDGVLDLSLLPADRTALFAEFACLTGTDSRTILEGLGP